MRVTKLGKTMISLLNTVVHYTKKTNYFYKQIKKTWHCIKWSEIFITCLILDKVLILYSKMLKANYMSTLLILENVFILFVRYFYIIDIGV